MQKLTDMPNIGKVVSQQLIEVGITTPAQLREIGGKRAWLRILEIDDSACYNRLCGLEGAVRGVRWRNLPEDVRRDLKVFYKEAKNANKA